MWIWIIGGIVVIIGFFVVGIYNRLITLKNRAQNAYKQIDVQTKKRFDLIPNLVESVKGYMKHERGVLTEVTKARTAVMNAKGVAGKAKAENMLTGALKTLFAVAENYPKLEASKNFLMVQEEISGIEGKIAYSRQFYNDNVLAMNETIQQFPTNTIAGMFGFKNMVYLEFEPESRKAVAVKF